MTVYEAAKIEARKIQEELKGLMFRLGHVLARMEKYKGSTMREAERVATAAEPYQITQLDEDMATGEYGAPCDPKRFGE